jgi:hypothetical protein
MVAGVGRKRSATAWTGLQAGFVETSAEARCGLVTFEAAHWSVSSLDPAMVPFDSTVQILISPVFCTCIQFTPDRARVTVVTVRRDTRGRDAGHGFSQFPVDRCYELVGNPTLAATASCTTPIASSSAARACANRELLPPGRHRWNPQKNGEASGSGSFFLVRAREIPKQRKLG